MRLGDNILVLSPHTDDAELACGGALIKFLEEGKNVHVMVFSAPSKELEAECFNAYKTLNGNYENPIQVEILDYPTRRFPEHRQEILQMLYDTNKKNPPDIVLTPCTSDQHQDHQTVTNEALRIFKQSTILGYELPWNVVQFTENGYIKITDKHLQIKTEALSQYLSQKNRHYFCPDYIRSLAYTRGGQIGGGYAEAFEIIRMVI